MYFASKEYQKGWGVCLEAEWGGEHLLKKKKTLGVLGDIHSVIPVCVIS